MKIINPSYEILRPQTMNEESKWAIYSAIETPARLCYKSANRTITPHMTETFLRNLTKSGHEAMLEHAHLSVKFTVDRGVSHEIVRHRPCSFAQESTRYCNYTQDKFGDEITVIKPSLLDVGSPEYSIWESSCMVAEQAYKELIQSGVTPEWARSVLPTSLKTEIVVTANMREWRHFFKLRAIGTTGKPHPQIQEVAMPLLVEVAEFLPAIFEDIILMEKA